MAASNSALRPGSQRRTNGRAGVADCFDISVIAPRSLPSVRAMIAEQA